MNSQRRLLLPAVLTIALLLAALGVRGLDLSRPVTPKPRPRAVIESQTNIIEEQIVKAFQTADLSPLPETNPPAHSHQFFILQSTKTTPSVTFAAIPSRAPPLI